MRRQRAARRPPSQRSDARELRKPPTSNGRRNPNVNTDFLPDQERDEAERRKRDELAKQYQQEQDAIKAELLEVTYSYHDPSGRDGAKGHRNTAQVPKGFTIEQFLNKCREQVRRPAYAHQGAESAGIHGGQRSVGVRCPRASRAVTWPRARPPTPVVAWLQVKELRSASADQLIYVKEDLIMPHSVSFYELIVKKARGKSGPLFQFDVHDDVRMVNDARCRLCLRTPLAANSVGHLLRIVACILATASCRLVRACSPCQCREG